MNDLILYAKAQSQWWVVAETFIRQQRTLRVICDACCRISEQQQHIPRHRVKGKAACGYVCLDAAGIVIDKRSLYLGEMTIDEAEYRGLIFALDNAVAYCRGEPEVWMDSEVIIRQMNGDYCLRSPSIRLLFDEVKKMELRFRHVRYFHHNRGSYWARQADQLANEEYSRMQKG